tara:strand:+ start:699 stop:2207 length:1509 start_codon:yes stop_codon:yes gene_type:complete
MIDLILKKPTSLKNDLLSGLTVALALVPEAIAFSFVAYVDPTVGLYAAFMMGLITAVFGGRPGMISGATGAVAVIFAPLVIKQTAAYGSAVALQYLFLAVIVMGCIQFLFGILKWGKFIRLVPHPVMLGFVNGLAIIIFKAQFAQFFVGSGSEKQLLNGIPLFVMVALIIVTMVICQFLPRLTKAVPATLVAILSVTGLSILIRSWGLDVYTVLDFIKTMDPTKTTIAASLPSFELPIFSLEALKLVFPYAFLAAFVGLIESLMTLVLIDELTDTKGSGNQESMAQGLANLINGFFGGMGGCAMIGQSMINIRAGGRSRLSGISAAFFLLLCFLFGAPVIEAIPLAALVGVMFMVSIATFEWSSFRIMKDIPKSDAFIIILVSAITVIVDLALAVFLGVIVAALVFAWQQGKIIRYGKVKHHDENDLYVLHGNIFFGSAQTFKELFSFAQDTPLVYIDFKDAKVVDHSAIEAVQNIMNRYQEQNKDVILLNLSSSCSRMLGM